MDSAHFPADIQDSVAAAERLTESDRRRLSQYASEEDKGALTIDSSLTVLRRMGWLTAALPGSWGGESLGEGGNAALSARSVESLMACAAANLSLARLFEGHVNAIGLVRRYADSSVQNEVRRLVHDGALLGVWGADDNAPVTVDRLSCQLSGTKRYTSGLGSVTHAVLTARCSKGTQLCLVDVTENERGNPEPWRMNGMRASASGCYCFDGIAPNKVSVFGEPDDFNKEPALVGGVWRIAALQLGATFGLLDAAREQLKSMGRLDNPAQLIRLTPLLYRATAARQLVEQAARLAEGPEGLRRPERAVSLSIFSRLLTEELGQDTVALVERSIGLPHFHDESDTGRQARDLSTYLRQVAPDAFLQRSGLETLGSAERLSELFPS